MDNTIATLIKVTGFIVYGLAAVNAFLCFVNDKPGILYWIAAGFVVGTMFLGFAEIIVLLQESYNMQYKINEKLHEK